MERRFFRAPNSFVILIVQIKGAIDPEKLRVAVNAVQKRHRLLQCRTLVDDKGNVSFTTENVQGIQVTATVRHTADQWLQEALDMQKTPFRITEQPPIIFKLLQGEDRSDLIICCHHMICDGLSLTYMARDIFECLAHPDREIALLPDPKPATRANIDAAVQLAPDWASRIQDANKAWEKQKVSFSEADYLELFDAYWKHYTFDARSIELSRSQTSRLLNRCRREQVTANTGLLALLLHTQYQVQGDDAAYLRRTGVAVSTRNFLLHPPGEAFGLYAAGAMFDFPCNTGNSLWDFARKLHQQIGDSTSKENILTGLASADAIDPTLLDAVQIKRFGHLIDPRASGHQKISEFCEREDVISAMERNRAKNAKRGVLLTNLARIDSFPNEGGLEVEKLFIYPGASDIFEKAFGALTFKGSLTLLISYIRECIDEETVSKFVATFEQTLKKELDL
ncbi:MAG: hypothetical protein KDI33_19605 [Halioglobus sp.]|nr:hypothetical protein [Halioglobus sp.]